MIEGREITGWMDLNISNIPNLLLKTTRPQSEEIFSSIQYLSEIEEVGLQFLESFGHVGKRKKSEIFKYFQAFIRQGKSFFEAAETLDYRSNPLFYYYSFLNLAKAYLCLKQPELFTKKIMHGLSHEHKSTKFEKQVVTVKGGLFPVLYKELTGEKITNNFTLNISKLFGYLPDIAHEFSLVDYGPRKFAYGYSKLCVNSTKKESWPLITLVKYNEIESFKSYFRNFNNYFEEVTINKDVVRKMLDIDASTMKHYSFYQSKTTYKDNSDQTIPSGLIAKDCFNVVGNYSMELSVKDVHNIVFFMPLQKNNQIPFNDTLASYVIMFYLGSLVRYFPHYLEGLLNSKHAWIIERFSKSIGVLFLRNINNLILKQNTIYYN